MKKSINFFLIATLCFSLVTTVFTSCKDDDDDDDDKTPAKDYVSVITKDTTWSGTVKFLGELHIKSGTTLTIAEGTVVKAKTDEVSSIIVDPGAKIMAVGTAQKPIIFTVDVDPGKRRAGDWGGIVLCGKAKVNQANPKVEGFSTPLTYGGTDDADNSGKLQYVRIEFAGFPLNPGNEINSLTLCGVGSGTVVENVQVSYGNDDSFEFFGGTVNCKNLISFRSVDDDFDTDFGYSGKIQFGIAIRDKAIADLAGDSNGFESDNDADGSTNTPKTSAVFSNFTLIGPYDSTTHSVNSAHNAAMRIRRKSELKIHNSVIVGFQYGFLVENSPSNGQAIKNCYFAANKSSYKASSSFTAADADALLAANGNVLNTTDKKQSAIIASKNKPTLKITSPTPDFTGMDAFFDKTVNFVGAIGATDWTAGWTNFDPQNTVY